jgi:hypothetical protein
VVAERSYVRAGITLDTEQDEAVFTIENLKFADGTDPEDAFHCTFPGGALVESPGELCGNLFNSVFVHFPMQPHQTDIFFIMLEKEGCKSYRIAEHDEKHPGDLWVERSRMSYLATEYPANPCSYLMA